MANSLALKAAQVTCRWPAQRHGFTPPAVPAPFTSERPEARLPGTTLLRCQTSRERLTFE